MNLFKNRTVIGIICILLSLLICFGVTPLFNKTVSQKTEIVRVAKEIKAGDEITKDMVQLVEVGGYGLPENVIRQTDTVVGKYASADLSIGDYILNTKLSDTPAAENAYLYNLDGTKQAISVTIKSFANGLSGKLQSGDIVSVIAADYKKQGATVIPAELKYVEVISVTASSDYDANTGEAKSEDDERELPSTVTLLVSPEQSKVLAELEADGKLHLSLVYRGTPANTAKFITAQEKTNAALPNEGSYSTPPRKGHKTRTAAHVLRPSTPPVCHFAGRGGIRTPLALSKPRVGGVCRAVRLRIQITAKPR